MVGLGAESTPREVAFERAWPEVETKLRRVLAARNVPVADWDDYLQEVAARALTADVEFHGADDLLPWATTVLRRLHIDLLRRSKRWDGLGLPQPQPPAGVDTEVIARLDVAAVVEIVSTWTPEARATLFHEDGTGTRQTNAFYLRRHRLRARLLAAMEGLGALGPIGAFRGWARRFGTRRLVGVRRFDAVAVEHASSAAAFLLPSVAAVCLSLVLGSGSAGPSPAGGARLGSLDTTSVASRRPSAEAGGVATGAATSTATGSPAGGRGAGASAGDTTSARRALVRTPIEATTSFEEGPVPAHHTLYNTDEPKPLACVTPATLPEQCVAHPLDEGPLAGTIPRPT